MSTYAIGDVQGCFYELEQLLTLIDFDTKRDTLWFTGDLVNRGPDSLKVLRFIKSLDNKHKIVLGNHDLHLLAVAYNVAPLKPKDTLQEILDAPDRSELIDWLRHLPLIYVDTHYHAVMCHAGVAPDWTVSQAQHLAEEVTNTLRSNEGIVFLKEMYGNEPNYWRDDLEGMPRLRCIVNYLTRMRYCDLKGYLDLVYKGALQDKPSNLVPWFELPNKTISQRWKIIFGHWAALGGISNVKNVYPIDTGCVWGNYLTALRLDDCEYFRVKSQRNYAVEGGTNGVRP